jgi:sugar (pentulose or hexulose) kinase
MQLIKWFIIDMQQKQNLFIGIDLGSSFIKISIIDQAQTCLNTVKVPS